MNIVKLKYVAFIFIVSFLLMNNSFAASYSPFSEENVDEEMFQNEVNPNMGYAIDWGTGQLPGGGFSTSGFSSGGEDDFLDDGGTEDASKFYVDAPISDGTYILILMIFAYATSKRFTKKRKIKKLI